MNFCEDCKNMLYIKTFDKDDELDEEGEPKSTQKLMYYCKSCGKEYEAANTKQSIYSINFNTDNIQKHTLINEYTLQDPTLPKAQGIKCPNVECKSKETKNPNIVYINYNEKEMKYIYACLDCYTNKVEPHIW